MASTMHAVLLLLPALSTGDAMQTLRANELVGDATQDSRTHEIVTLRNGVAMPLVSVGAGGGAALTPLSRAGAREIKSTVGSALQEGYRGVDTAYDYQCCGFATSASHCGSGGERRESGVAQAISGYNRSDLFLTTKVPGCAVSGDGGAPSATACYEDSLSIAQKDLAKLGIASADLTLLHFPPDGGCSSEVECLRAQQQWAALEALHADGKARAIGVSDYCQDCLECLARNSTVTPMVNRVQHHIGMGPDPSGLHSYCADHGIQIAAYGVLAAGGGPFPSAGTGSQVKAIGKAHGKSGYQVALRWIVQRAIPIVVRAASAKHFASDIDILDWELTEAEMSSLDRVAGPSCKDRRWPNAPEKCCSGSSVATDVAI